jgi:uncharacterized protein
MRSINLLVWVIVGSVSVFSTGCSTFRSYKTESLAVVQDINRNDIDQALSKIESSSGKDKDILYYFEKGELLRLKKANAESIATWREADHMLDEWESEAKVNMSKVGAGAASLIINDKLMRYDGQDYEKVMLTTKLALNYISTGDLNSARVYIKKTGELQDFIAELHSKEIQKEEDAAKEKGVKRDISTINGYPIASLNTPEVNLLKNGYQNAFSEYLAGYVYEALGNDLAQPAYKRAVELKPDSQMLKDSLTKAVKGQSISGEMSDVLLVVENGVAPTISSVTIPLPIPKAGLVPISFPVLDNDPSSTIVGISVKYGDNKSVKLEKIANIDAMARKSLKDRLPGIMLRGVIRAAVKGASQAAVNQQNAAAGALLNVVNVVTESADERIWKTLPSSISIARINLPKGSNKLILETSAGTKEISVDIKNKYELISMRVMPNAFYNLR